MTAFAMALLLAGLLGWSAGRRSGEEAGARACRLSVEGVEAACRVRVARERASSARCWGAFSKATAPVRARGCRGMGCLN